MQTSFERPLCEVVIYFEDGEFYSTGFSTINRKKHLADIQKLVNKGQIKINRSDWISRLLNIEGEKDFTLYRRRKD